MIKVMMLGTDGQCAEGGKELLQTWKDSPGSRLWMDIEGEYTEDAGQILHGLGCDELAIKDCFRVRHPPKLERFSSSTFILFRGISKIESNLSLEPQQIGLWVGEDFMISVHRGHSVSIESFWVTQADQPLLGTPNLLALNLLHFASGRYLEKLLEFEGRLADMEDGLLSGNSEERMKELVLSRSRLRKLRRIFNYHERLAEDIWRQGSPFLGQGEDASSHVRRDVYDRCERVCSLCNMFYEQCGDLVEGHISLTSHKLNNTMKVLTIITAVFVPLGFLAGLYGMNFDNIPELHWEYSYYVLLGVMATLASTMLYLFRRFKWL